MSKNFISIMSHFYCFVLGLSLALTIIDSENWWVLVTALIFLYITAALVEGTEKNGVKKCRK